MKSAPDSSLSDTFAQATQAHQAGQWEQAEDLYRRVLAQAPNHADAHHLLGLVLSRKGNHTQAVRHVGRAIAVAGDNPFYHNNLGEVWRRQDRQDKAIPSYKEALRLHPGFPEAHYNLANVLKAQGQLDEAIDHYRRAVRLKPDYASAHYNLGNALLEQGQLKSAMSCYQRVIQLNPQFAEAHNNLGIVFKEGDRLEEAIDSYGQALKIKPDFAEAHRNLGLVLEKQGKIDLARTAYQRAVKLEPDNALFRFNVETLCPVISASSQEIDEYRSHLMTTLDRTLAHGLQFDLSQLHVSGGEPPFVLAYQGRDDHLIKAKYGEIYRHSFPAPRRKISKGKPHFGFVVTHGHEGVFLKCMRGILNHLPADQFRLTVVCSRQAGERILRPSITNPEVAYLPLPSRFDHAMEKVKEARFDILHYWEVGTDVTNYFLPYCCLAPVQCATWGWPITTGIPQMGYFVSCELLETEESDAHYTETLIRLQHLPTYYYRPPVPEASRSRGHFGLGEGQHLYLCTQNLRKVHPDFDDLAADILRRDPQGLLLFIEDKQPNVTQLLRHRLQGSMPDVAARVRFLSRMPEIDYLSLTALADVVLDTLHYGGGANTTYDAFAASTPVVTLPTRFHRGRYAFAAYRQMGVSDCIADSAEDYANIAVRLGTDPACQAEVSGRITEACPVLFEDANAVTELAAFFEEALARAGGR